MDTCSSLKHLSDETKRSWFKIEEIVGHKILKVKPEMFTPPEVKGEPGFLEERVTTYKKQEARAPALEFEDDFYDALVTSIILPCASLP